MVAEVYGELTEAETAKLLDYITGQLSDGYVLKNHMRRNKPKAS
jgi:hypothetical protein